MALTQEQVGFFGDLLKGLSSTKADAVLAALPTEEELKNKDKVILEKLARKLCKNYVYCDFHMDMGKEVLTMVKEHYNIGEKG